VSETAIPEILSADYLVEARDLPTVPSPGPLEVAFAGRSNVGKSTLLNRVAGRRSLARTSKTPGRTRGIIFYDLGVRLPGETARRTLRLIDLPGYGFARVGKSERGSWGELIEGYVEGRAQSRVVEAQTLKLFLVLVDPRRGVETEERQLCEWLDTLAVPQHLVLTKVDKLSATERGQAKERCRAAFGGSAPPITLVSGTTGEGLPALWRTLARVWRPAAPPIA
jgi:GTP-binding protein